MKNKIKFLALAGVVITGIASLSTLTAYADNSTVTAVVNPLISLDVTPSTVDLRGNAGSVMTGNISAKVTSNSRYTISFRTKETNTSMVSSEVSSTYFIPASENVVAGTNAWGIKAKTGEADNANETNYTAIDNSNPGKVLYTSNSGNTGQNPLKFEVGISTSSSIAAGTYSVDLIVTAGTF